MKMQALEKHISQFSLFLLKNIPQKSHKTVALTFPAAEVP
jgi:hypothetical protein